MAYVDYGYYANEYGGKLIPEGDFGFAAEKAADMIKAAIFYRNVPEIFLGNVRRCCCELAEIMYKNTLDNADNGGGAVASEKIGEYSVTYRSNTELLQSERERENICYGIIVRHLAHTGLLFRGVD